MHFFFYILHNFGSPADPQILTLESRNSYFERLQENRSETNSSSLEVFTLRQPVATLAGENNSSDVLETADNLTHPESGGGDFKADNGQYLMGKYIMENEFTEDSSFPPSQGLGEDAGFEVNFYDNFESQRSYSYERKRRDVLKRYQVELGFLVDNADYNR